MTQNLMARAKKATPFKKPRSSKTGKLGKKASTFLEMCKKQFGFEPAREFIEHYSREMTMYQDLWYNYSDIDRRQTMSEVDIEMFWKMHDALKESLKIFMKYSYPTMRATQVKNTGAVAPVFNINLAPVEVKQEKITTVNTEGS